MNYYIFRSTLQKPPVYSSPTKEETNNNNRPRSANSENSTSQLWINKSEQAEPRLKSTPEAAPVEATHDTSVSDVHTDVPDYHKGEPIKPLENVAYVNTTIRYIYCLTQASSLFQVSKKCFDLLHTLTINNPEISLSLCVVSSICSIIYIILVGWGWG